MDNNEVKRRIKLIEKHMQGECEIEYLTENMSEWETLCNSNSVYYMLLMDVVEFREKLQALEVWCNVYDGDTSYHHSVEEAINNASCCVVRTAVHMKEVL